jgi:hypothetical protein
MPGKGYVKLHRELLDSDVWQNQNCLKVFVWALLSARHTEGQVRLQGECIPLEPGQFISGRFAGSKACGMHPSTFWDQIMHLEAAGTLRAKSDNRKTVFTVVNWARFQGNGAASDSRPTTARHKQERKKQTTAIAAAEEMAEQLKQIRRQQDTVCPN